jgi:signal transduction histidine kinase
LLAAMLSREGLQCELVFASGASEFESALGQGKFDLIMSDFTLPDYDGVSETPFVLVSGTIGEERAVRMLKSGATDCVLKDSLARLSTVVRRALAEAEERKKRRQAEEALREQALQLRALAGRLEASREEERRRISREIHDELGEVLTSQKLGLMWIKQRLNALKQPEAMKPETLKAELLEPIFSKIDFLGTLTDGTAKRVRRLCTELRPPILDDLGLTAAIEWQAREFQNRTSIECVTHPDSVTVELEPESATALFRIFQEILTNVLRHAKASRVEVELSASNGHLILEVKDNGRGIPENKLAGGISLGILGMRERAVLLGGKLGIRGTPGKGTTVIVSIPIKNNHHIQP